VPLSINILYEASFITRHQWNSDRFQTYARSFHPAIRNSYITPFRSHRNNDIHETCSRIIQRELLSKLQTTTSRRQFTTISRRGKKTRVSPPLKSNRSLIRPPINRGDIMREGKCNMCGNARSAEIRKLLFLEWQKSGARGRGTRHGSVISPLPGHHRSPRRGN